MKDFFEKLLGSQPVIIILILGAIFIALAAIGVIPLNETITVFDEKGRNIFLAVGIVLLVVSLLLVFRSTSFSIYSAHSITLSYPKGSDDGKFLPITKEETEIGGEHKNRSLGKYEFRLVVLDHSRKKFWPQDPKRLNWSENGKWSATLWFQHVNDEKIILAVLVPPSGIRIFDYYLQNAKATNWAPVQGSLPDDFIKIGEVKLKRVA